MVRMCKTACALDLADLLLRTAILSTLRDPNQNVTRVGQRVTEAKCRGRGLPSSNTGIQLEPQAAPCYAPNLALEK
jgi:hypothetical protein